MQIHYGLEKIFTIKNPVVTTGSFDGVHVGHKVILNRLRRLAKEIQGESVLITFHPHPRKVLYPETAGKDLLLINSQEEKIELLRNTQLDHLIIVNFTIEFSKISSIDFIRKILVEKLNSSCVIVGFNHHFGHNREGDYEYLRELGKYYNFEVEEIPEQDIDNETVSSTKIRKALIDGNIQRANAYLDHHYIIKGKIEKSDDSILSDTIDSLSVGIEEECKLVPPDGIYAIHVIAGNIYHKGMAIVIRPPGYTHNSVLISVKLYLVNLEEELINKSGTVFFHKQIRDASVLKNNQILKTDFEESFEEIEELIY
jgi:riboflavin kinase / FMN adenylyltransferase